MLETFETTNESTNPNVNRRSLIVLGVVVLAVLAAILVNVLKAPGMLDAQGTAEAFLHSLTTCDKAGVQKYAPADYSEGSTQLANFETSCTGAKSGGTFAFVKDYGNGINKIVSGKHVQTDNFEYSIGENGQTVSVIVQMAKASDDTPWEVSQIGAASTP